jgi:DNA-binding transcriptional ArsR family regulator/2-polyprenyl-3-methyl-5-hydroxy-6-metoxy-1,4-benzoquinol methylase
MSIESALLSLKAAADPTRLRLLALLAGGEATVGELQEILGQSQPRVSRHLRLLVDADLVTRFRDGQWMYYRLATTPSVVDTTRHLVEMIGPEDPALVGDRNALLRVKQGRERDAYNAQRNSPWLGAPRSGDRPAASVLRETIDDNAGENRFGDVLEVGCENGALLCLLGENARNVIGVDTSKSMRLLARSRVHRSGLTNCTVRGADLPVLPFEDAAFDLVVLSLILGSAADTLDSLREARRVLKPDGRLMIVDRIQPAVRHLTKSTANGQLVENQLTALLGELGCKIFHRTWFPGRVMEYALISAKPEVASMRTGTHD